MPAPAEQFSQLRTFPLSPECPIYMNRGELLYAEEIVFLHWHDCFEFALCLEGNAVFDIAGQGVQAVKPGDIYFISPGRLHYSRSIVSPGSQWLWVYCNFPLLLTPYFPSTDWSFLDRMSHCGYAKLMTDELEIGDLLQALHHNRHDLDECRAFCLLLIKRMKRRFERDCAAGLPELASLDRNCQSAGSERIRKALQLIVRKFSQKLTVGEMARTCGMSVNNFRRVFTSITGVAPLLYLNQYRCAMAKAYLLDQQHSITDIAWDCGYPTISSFNRQFLALVGMSPSDFRKKHR